MAHQIGSKWVIDLLMNNPASRSAFHAMRQRQMSCEQAQGELLTAFLGCLWEMKNEEPNRWLSILEGLKEGRSAQTLLPRYFCGQNADIIDSHGTISRKSR